MIVILGRVLGMFRRQEGQHRSSESTQTYTISRDRQATARSILADLVASYHLETAQARSAEVADLADSLRQIRERNHFGETVRRALL